MLLETGTEPMFELITTPLDAADCSSNGEEVLTGSVPAGIRHLAEITIGLGAIDAVAYVVDGLELRDGAGLVKLTFPRARDGFLVRGSERVGIGPSSKDGREVRFETDDRSVTLITGRWSICVTGDRVTSEDGLFWVVGEAIAVGFSAASAASREAEDIRRSRDEIIECTRAFWDAYLASCPLVNLEELPALIDEVDNADFIARQLWHWWALLMNVWDPAHARPYISPDRSRWFGTWSSDGPISLSALGLTNQADLAARLLGEYIRTSINAAGDLAWYTHSYGRPGLGQWGDSGVFSHGVPDVVVALEFLSRVMGREVEVDDGIGGRTLYETVAWYMRSGFDSRDHDRDGLWEMRNIWEGAWDDKASVFFDAATLDQWVDALTTFDQAKLAVFIEENRRPVATMYEAVALMSALAALRDLADRRSDTPTRDWAAERLERAREVIRDRHWSAADSVYRDWDIKGGKLNLPISSDNFYYLVHETEPQRARALRDLVADGSRFGLERTPTLDRQDSQYDAGGYWKGSYWPRESFYVSRGLAENGFLQDAAVVLAGALMSGEGCEVLEHVNADDGSRIRFHSGNAVMTQAMSVGICLGLLGVTGRISWASTR